MSGTAIGTPDLARVFRQLSQKRKQGILELHKHPLILKIYIHAGKVVAAHPIEITMYQDVALALSEAAFLDPNIELGIVENFEDLYREVSALNPSIDEEVFQRVVQQRILDNIFQCDLEGEGYYNFKVQGVDFEPEYVSPITIGSLLIDFATFKANEKNFLSIFPEASRVRLNEKNSLDSIDIDSDFLTLLRMNLPINELFKRSLINRSMFQERLLSLYEQSLVEVSVSEQAESFQEVGAASIQINEAPPQAALGINLQASVSKIASAISIPKIKKAELFSRFSEEFAVLFILAASVALPLLLWRSILQEF